MYRNVTLTFGLIWSIFSFSLLQMFSLDCDRFIREVSWLHLSSSLPCWVVLSVLQICVKLFYMCCCWHSILTGMWEFCGSVTLSRTDVRSPPSCASLQAHRKNKQFQHIQPADRREMRVIPNCWRWSGRRTLKIPKPRRGFWVVLMHVCAALMRLRVDSSLMHLKEQKVEPPISLEDLLAHWQKRRVRQTTGLNEKSAHL